MTYMVSETAVWALTEIQGVLFFFWGGCFGGPGKRVDGFSGESQPETHRFLQEKLESLDLRKGKSNGKSHGFR